MMSFSYSSSASMRVATYFITFVAVASTLLLNYLSSQRPDWLVVQYTELFYTRVTISFGLSQRCQLMITETSDGKFVYRSYDCRKFPTVQDDHCNKDEYKHFCAAWTSAFYLDQVALGLGAISLVTVLFGMTTHSRRRRMWTSVAGLLFLTASCQIAVFTLITDLYYKNTFPFFEHARPALGYIVHTISWVLNSVIVLGILVTGFSADVGYTWAAGPHPYQTVRG